MSSLFTVDDVKDFFSQPSSTEPLRKLEAEIDDLFDQLKKEKETTTCTSQKLKMIRSLIKKFKRDNRWTAASFHSFMMVKAPTILLK